MPKWIVADSATNRWTESLFLGHDELGVPDVTVSKRRLRGGRREGVDVVDINNGHLSFSVVPTRGMGIWKAEYRGTPLGWESPTQGPVNPAFVNALDRGGLGWLEGFDEWVCRCGLDSMGAPGTDVVKDNNGNPAKVTLALHGKIANIPAHFVEIESDPATKTVKVSGVVDESALFYPGLRLKTTVSTQPLSNRLTIEDTVVNLKGTPSELEILYHCNYGAPLLEEGAQLLAPFVEMAPRDARAAEGVDEFATYLGPTAGYVEQVYFYKPLADANNRTVVALRNAAGDKASALRFDTTQLPYFSQWKNTVASGDGYVTGIEPGSAFPNLKTIERDRGRVITLKPGGSRSFRLDLEAFVEKEAVGRLSDEIAALQKTSKPIIHKKPNARFS